MKASLQLKLGQSLTMTPQLQQAIRLLQLSTLDLQNEIQEALDSNPLLEVEENFEGNEANTKADDNGAGHEYDSSSTLEANNDSNDFDSNDSSTIDTSEALDKQSISDDLPTDTTWDDYISAGPAAPVASSTAGPESDFVYQGETTENLQDHLLWQANLTPFSDNDRAIATAIIDAVEESGYLSQDCEDILTAMADPEIELDEVEAVLKRIQHFDPIGVAARSPSECLAIQLKRLAEDTPWRDEAILLVEGYMELLATRDYRTLAKKTKLKEAQLAEAIRLIQTLNPHPGSTIIKEKDEYVIPDVSVKKVKGRWIVELNPDCMPKIQVNAEYAALSKTSKSSGDTQFIRGHLQEAKWFIKSLESRNDTLLKVANCIVMQQRGFFEYGEEAMKPLVLNDVAEAVEMHESTISRVTTQKYMHTPRGIFELKYFFSSHVSTENGGECSSTAIRAIIKKLVAAESPKKPLSDSKIVDLLAEQGIKVARRTIAKYRDALSIPPSNQRKSLI
ncbi:RNA polymerase factor sigma-54 [Psychrobium sp. 1_MG-2023]|uniref:RNA polymerase factor sigma-54 n=1 Tax=Psychrobium sp. 1_MG-2023 TaxID=3062624 RepID=UPI000C346FC5|nr:RNA polymerase factor sigma-54 [Psychrobium sp. 1_MG-2023]MDP2560705.1 RNA polymerase factor sigma-54 [Psychrobium sp. 1_MG-2023]PKF56600.1 RNA polymerase factor sigma-54 [Alteromonadales bacterium alter-6D02]